MDSILLAKYDRRIPRYTSYPTAPHFHSRVGPETYGRWLGDLSKRPQTASIYLHVPFCAELCHYCGCHTAAVRKYGPVQRYADLLIGEIDLVGDAIGDRLGVSHIHWGGGTPTMLAPDDWRRIVRALRDRFDVAPSAEIAVEIDPRILSLGAVGALAASGVTRASIGVQDFDPVVQRAVNRIQSYEDAERAIRWLRQAGIRGINVDLMYGLPYQTADGVAKSVRQALSLRPDRVALFGYAHVPWLKKHQRLIPEDALPDAEERFRQQSRAAECLADAGFVRIGLDHFARPDDPMAVSLSAGALHRNFQGYTTDDAPVLLGLGASSIGSQPQGYVQNAASIPDYAAAILDGRLATVRGVELETDDRLRREIIERLMCDLAVDVGAVCAKYGADATAFAAEFMAVDALAGDGLAVRDGGRIAVTETGRPLVRAVCAVFDRYLEQSAGRHAPAV